MIQTELACNVLWLEMQHKLNPLSLDLIAQLKDILETAETNDDVHVVVLTGKSFSVGADISELSKHKTTNFINEWECVKDFKKPIIAAVLKYALGGGFELAMMCDIIVAEENAIFSQPEIHLALMPGAGGTQFLSHTVGKAKAMDLCLSGRRISAKEAYEMNIISRVYPEQSFTQETKKLAEEIAQFDIVALKNIKNAIKQSLELPLTQGIIKERQLFHALLQRESAQKAISKFVARTQKL